jgi:mannan endo-1,4-beta-mannosidase
VNFLIMNSKLSIINYYDRHMKNHVKGNFNRNDRNTAIQRLMLFLAMGFFLLTISLSIYSQPKEEVLKYLRNLGNGSYMFGQIATWVHNENPDMDHSTNWLRKIYDHTGKLPRYGCITYDYDDNPFTDSEWNEGVKKMWDKGMIVGVYNFFANPSGGSWRDQVFIDPIFSTDDNPTKSNFYHQMDRMALNMQWLKERGITVIYTPFVELNDKNKWHAREGSKNAIRLYRLVHDYFTARGLNNIIWAYHTTQGDGALEEYYPGDDYVDVLGKSAYGTGLIFSEYSWAVDKKKNQGKVIWWAELGIRGSSDPPRDCFDVLSKLENSFPELAGFVFWSDDKYYNVTGNLNGPEFMAHPKIITLK